MNGTSDARIGVYSPHLGEQELVNLSEAIASNALIRGEFATRFERQIADYVGCPFGVGTNSGTAALHTALMIAGVRAGDEVLITTLTFIAPANAITYVGAHPVFIDVEEDSWQMDPVQIQRFIDECCDFDGDRLLNRNTGRPVTAIVVVHFLGVPADMDAIGAIAACYHLKLIEDAAQALGTVYNGRRVGGIAPLGCFSFYGNKLITAGGGGMVVTHDQAMAERARYLVNQAKDDPVETLHTAVGYNYRMTNIHGAIGCAQFERIEAHIRAKRAIAARYAEAFERVPGITMIREREGEYYTFWLSSIRIDSAAFGMTARALLTLLDAQGIEAIPLYQPLHLSKAHPDAQRMGGQVAEMLALETLSLPSSVGLTEESQDRVIRAILAAASQRLPRPA